VAVVEMMMRVVEDDDHVAHSVLELALYSQIRAFLPTLLLA
jgi:hypothetical protein